jgi:hypothetical protein
VNATLHGGPLDGLSIPVPDKVTPITLNVEGILGVINNERPARRVTFATYVWRGGNLVFESTEIRDDGTEFVDD